LGVTVQGGGAYVQEAPDVLLAAVHTWQLVQLLCVLLVCCFDQPASVAAAALTPATAAAAAAAPGTRLEAGRRVRMGCCGVGDSIEAWSLAQNLVSTFLQLMLQLMLEISLIANDVARKM
jgi:hypothetical protein